MSNMFNKYTIKIVVCSMECKTMSA